MSVNLEMVLPHLVPLRQRTDSVLHLCPRWMMESLEQALIPASLVVKGSPVFCVSCMDSAACDKDQHSSRSLSTSVVGEKIDKYQPFWRRAIWKLFALGKRHLLLFYAKDQKGMFQLRKNKISRNKAYSSWNPAFFPWDISQRPQKLKDLCLEKFLKMYYSRVWHWFPYFFENIYETWSRCV